MTLEQIEYLASLREAGGHSTMPVPLSEWREWQQEKAMATKSIGRATVKDGKVKPVASMPLHRKIAAKAKADRKEAGLRANAAKRKGAA